MANYQLPIPFFNSSVPVAGDGINSLAVAINPLLLSLQTLINTDPGSIGQATLAAKLPKVRSKLANIRAGLTTGTNGINGQLKLGLIGDSTTMGAGAGTGGTTNTTNARPKCIGRILPAQFIQLGIAAIADTFMGDQGYFVATGSVTNYPVYDPRLAFTGTTGIFPDGGYRAAGGIYFQLKAGTDSLTFTPENAWDTAVIYYENGATGVATMTLGNAAAITGTPTVTTTSSGSASFGNQSITITKAATSLIFTRTSGSPVIRGVWCYDSTTPRVNVFNLGDYGSELRLDSPKIIPCLASDAYDCVVINQCINDATLRGVDGVTNYITALDNLVVAAQAAGSDVVVTTANANTVTSMFAYTAAIENYSVTKGIPLIDLNVRMGTYAISNANGLMYDSFHPSASGYQDIATAYGSLLIRP